MRHSVSQIAGGEVARSWRGGDALAMGGTPPGRRGLHRLEHRAVAAAPPTSSLPTGANVPSNCVMAGQQLLARTVSLGLLEVHPLVTVCTSKVVPVLDGGLVVLQLVVLASTVATRVASRNTR